MKSWVLAFGLIIMMTSFAHAEPVVVTWESAPQLAEAAWSSLGEAEIEARLEGFEGAASQLPGVVKSLGVDGAMEFSVDGGDLLGDAEIGLGVELELGDIQSSLLAANEAQRALYEAQLSSSRWSYVQAVMDAYIQWLVADAEWRELNHYQTVITEELQPLVEAAENQLMSKLDYQDIQVELGAVAAELAIAEYERAEAHALLEALLLEDVEPQVASCFSVESPDFMSKKPWLSIGELLHAHPIFVELEGESQWLRAQAALLERSNSLWQLSPSLLYHLDPAQESWVGVGLGLVLPQQDSNGVERYQLESEALALEMRQSAELRKLESWVAGEEKRFEAAQGYLQLLTSDYLAPMQQRQVLLEEAYGSGNIAVERLIRGRRDIHEAHHMLLKVESILLTHCARAKSMEALLSVRQEQGE